MTLSITRRNEAGDLENADTVTLSDSAATYGIIRDSDSVVVLAAGTATTNDSTGVYSYDESALALDPTESYTVGWKVVKAGLPTVYITTRVLAEDTAATLVGLRRALAGELKRYQKMTTTDVAAAGNDATRTLICSTLVNDDGTNTQFKGVWIYISSGALAGEQRRMRQAGYTPGTGTLVTRRPFTGTPASGIDFEMHWRLPVLTEDGVSGLHEHLNRALSVLHIPQRYEIEATAGEESYAAPSWLRHQQQVGVLLDPQTDASVNPLTTVPGGARLRTDAQLNRIELLSALYTTGETFAVEIARPAKTFIKSGGAWDTSTSGLVSDTDETAADPILVVQTALAYCYQELARISNGVSDVAKWQALADAQEQKALWLRFHRQPRIGGDDEAAVGEKRQWRPTITRRSGAASRW